MGTNHITRAARVLKVHCPIDAATMDLLMAGRVAAIDADGTLAAMLRILRDDNPLGDFGAYRSVLELSPGWELFTPGAAARPAFGRADADAVSPTAVLTIYIPGDAPPDAVTRAIDAIVEAHPWEVPVIELNETCLVTRA